MRTPKYPSGTPGSTVARKNNCICPVMDNCHGKGYRGEKGAHVIHVACPLHRKSTVLERAAEIVRLHILHHGT